MKKNTLNEELNRMQEMMGVCPKHVSPSGTETTMCPDDDDYETLDSEDESDDEIGYRKKNYE